MSWHSQVRQQLSSLAWKCCEEASLLHTQAVTGNSKKEILKETSALFPWAYMLFWKPGDCFRFCTAFWKLNVMSKFDSCPNPLDYCNLERSAKCWTIHPEILVSRLKLSSQLFYYLWELVEGGWGTARQENSRSLKRRKGWGTGQEKPRNYSWNTGKLNFYPWKNSVVNKQTKICKHVEDNKEASSS